MDVQPWETNPCGQWWQDMDLGTLLIYDPTRHTSPNLWGPPSFVCSFMNDANALASNPSIPSFFASQVWGHMDKAHTFFHVPCAQIWAYSSGPSTQQFLQLTLYILPFNTSWLLLPTFSSLSLWASFLHSFKGKACRVDGNLRIYLYARRKRSFTHGTKFDCLTW